MTAADGKAIADAIQAGMVFSAMVGVGSSLLTAHFIDYLQGAAWRSRARARRKRLAAIRARRMVRDAQQAVIRG